MTTDYATLASEIRKGAAGAATLEAWLEAQAEASLWAAALLPEGEEGEELAGPLSQALARLGFRARLGPDDRAEAHGALARLAIYQDGAYERAGGPYVRRYSDPAGSLWIRLEEEADGSGALEALRR